MSRRGFRSLPNKPSGFTLAELLIALAVLGIIAAFTIPKVLTSQQSNKDSAILKETVSALEDIILNGIKRGEINTASPDMSTYVKSRINAIRVCANATADGCWIHASDCPFPAEFTESGYILANGATLAGFRDAITYEGFMIDANGATPPNLLGQDQLYLTYDTEATPLAIVIAPFGPESEALYAQMWR